MWTEHVRRYLLPWHVVAFWTGFLFDVSGTTAMELLEPGFAWSSLHTTTVWLMSSPRGPPRLRPNGFRS